MNEQNTQESVGAFLKQQREAQKISVKEISEAINVRTGQITAIEDGNLKELPGMVYAVGFVRSYATHLGLDSDDAVKRFKSEHAADTPATPELVLQTSTQENQLPSSFMLIGAGAGLIIVVAIWFIFLSAGNTPKTDKQIPDVPEHLQAQTSTENDPVILANNAENNIDSGTDAANTAPQTDNQAQTATQTGTTNTPVQTSSQAPETETPQNVSQQNTAQQTTQRIAPTPQEDLRQPKRPAIKREQSGQTFGEPRHRSRISLKALDSSYIVVKDAKGKTLFQKVLRPGQIYRAPRQNDLKLTTANAGGLEVYVDGKKVAPFGKKGDIIHGILLDPKTILNNNR